MVSNASDAETEPANEIPIEREMERWGNEDNENMDYARAISRERETHIYI